MFSDIPNTILTIIVAYFLISILANILPWVFSPTWNSVSLTECRGVLAELGRSGHGGGGACWGVIRERWLQLLFGFYPSELYWRPILAFILLGLALAPVLFDKAFKKTTLPYCGISICLLLVDLGRLCLVPFDSIFRFYISIFRLHLC